ncbi:MAG: hypothetical protein AABW88_01025 [Nanoarchaeota archaeon]
MDVTKEEWEAVKKSLIHLESSVNRIERAIAGDEQMGVEGIVYKVGAHEKKINDYDYKFQKIEEIKNKGYGFLAAFGIVCGSIGTGIWEGVKHLINVK